MSIITSISNFSDEPADGLRGLPSTSVSDGLAQALSNPLAAVVPPALVSEFLSTLRKSISSPYLTLAAQATAMAEGLKSGGDISQLLSPLIIMFQESRFAPGITNATSTATGFMQIINSTATGLVRHLKNDYAGIRQRLAPLLKLVASLDPAVAPYIDKDTLPIQRNQRSGFVDSLYAGLNYNALLATLGKYFYWDGHSWTPKGQVINEKLLSYFAAHPGLFQDYGAGRQFLLTYLNADSLSGVIVKNYVPHYLERAFTDAGLFAALVAGYGQEVSNLLTNLKNNFQR